MSLLQATAFSVNTIYAQVALPSNVEVVNVAHRMGIESPLLPVCSLTLGPESLPARDDQRLRDAGGARDPPSCRDAPARDRAGRQGRAPDSS